MSDDLTPDEYEEIAPQVEVIQAAWRFLRPFIQRRDLEAAWPLATPAFQQHLVGWWTEANLEALGSTERTSTLAEEAAGHELWRHFERVVLRDWAGLIPAEQFE